MAADPEHAGLETVELELRSPSDTLAVERPSFTGEPEVGARDSRLRSRDGRRPGGAAERLPLPGGPQSQATDGCVGGYGSTPSSAHANTIAMPARSHSDSVGTIPLLQCQP